MAELRSTEMRRIVAALSAVLGLALTVFALGGMAVASADATAPTGEPTTEPTTESTTEPATDLPSDPSSDPPTEAPSDPVEETTAPSDATIEITDATFRWGINHEANTAAYNPGTYNFFAAGKIPDPGRANQFVPKRNWRQRSGNVTIEKWSQSRRRWTPATWPGLRTDSAGRPLIVGGDSQHNLVFGGGTGVRDPEAGTAHVEWTGSASVVFYSGYSFFYLSDPVLDVAGSRGTVTALVSGFAATRDGTGWELLAAQRVVVATMSAKSLDAVGGFTSTPDYTGVRVEVAEGIQKRDEVGWGAFPQPFVTYMDRMGIGSFWYSSGGAADSRKPPLPITVSYDDDAAAPPTPTTSPTEVPTVENTAADPPPSPTTPTPAAPLPLPDAPALPDQLPVDTPLLAAARPVAPQVQLVSATTAPGAAEATRGWMWWSGGVVVLLAAVLALLPIPPRRT